MLINMGVWDSVPAFILLVNETHFLPLEGAVLPSQIALSFRGGVSSSGDTAERGGCGRGRTASVSQSEAVADQASSFYEDISQCVGPAWWVRCRRVSTPPPQPPPPPPPFFPSYASVTLNCSFRREQMSCLCTLRLSKLYELNCKVKICCLAAFLSYGQ